MKYNLCGHIWYTHNVSNIYKKHSIMYHILDSSLRKKKIYPADITFIDYADDIIIIMDCLLDANRLLYKI